MAVLSGILKRTVQLMRVCVSGMGWDGMDRYRGRSEAFIPRAILSTLMMRMMVGLMGSEALTSISSRVMPMMDSSTMARSS